MASGTVQRLVTMTTFPCTPSHPTTSGLVMSCLMTVTQKFMYTTTREKMDEYIDREKKEKRVIYKV